MSEPDQSHNLLHRWLDWKGLPWMIWIVGIILVCLQIEFRPLDRDEGFYLFGAWRVFRGEMPYLDFFYPQAPYLPFIYAPVVGFYRDGILGGRILSAAISIGLAILCARWVTSRSQDRRLGLLTGGLMLFGNLELYWHSAVKTYAVSDLLLVAGFVLMMSSFRESRPAKVLLLSFLGGLLFGTAFNIRLVLAGAVPYLLLLSLLAPGWGRVRRFLGLLAGMVIASIPALMLFAADPVRYWFQNLTFHITARLPHPWWQFALQKITAFGEYLSSLDILVLVILCAVGLRAITKSAVDLPSDFKREIWKGIGLAGILFATYLTAPPLLPQYLVQLSPFLVFGAIAGVAAVLKEPRESTGPAIVLILLLAYGGWGVGKAVGRMVERQDLAPLSGTKTVREVGRYIEGQTGTDDQILTFWPAYLVAAHRNPVPGTDFGRPAFRLEWRNPPDVIHQEGLTTQLDVKDLITNRVPSVVVCGFDTPPDMLPFLDQYYLRGREIRGVTIYMRQ